MITIQASFQSMGCYLVCLGAIISMPSCSTVCAAHHMSRKLYSECLRNTKTLPVGSVVTTIDGPKQATKKIYTLHSRVRRWSAHKIKDAHTIKAFTDHGKALYESLTEDQIWLAQAIHEFPGLMDVITHLENQGNKGKYFTNTSQAIAAKASLVLKTKQNEKHLYSKGRIKIIIDTKHSSTIKVYHMMFHRNEKLPIKVLYPEHGKQVEKNTKKDTARLSKDKIKLEIGAQKMGFTTEDMNLITENKGKGYRIGQKRNDYVIHYSILPKASPYKSKRLYIHPINK